MHQCRTCLGQTPDGHFCVRCGAPLARAQALTHARHRREFAAAPDERRYAPWLVSTLFPRLPRHSERHFYGALLGGAGGVAVLAALRLFPVALIVAAGVMPCVTILYFRDIDVYEGEPAWALGWTVGWGALAGIGVGLLAKVLAPTGSALIDRGSTAHVVTGGLLLPALGVLLALVGPLVLLRYRKFDDVLDGACFGAASAAALAGAEAIVVGIDVLGGGLRPPGAAAPWVERLLGLSLAYPVLAMAAVGAAQAAVWLRSRGRAVDRRALGPAGEPAIALALALLLVVAGAVGETFMASGTWLASLVTLDLIALVVLRRALHVGLMQEADERELGPEAECVNCGAMTVTHTFCGDCGVSLRALSKAALRSGRTRLIESVCALATVVAIGVVVGTLGTGSEPKASCTSGSLCGNPPVFSRVAFAFPGDTVWASTGLGYSLRYPNAGWKVANSDPDDVTLESIDGSVLVVNALRSSKSTPAELIKVKLSRLRGQLLGFTRDTNAADQLLGTDVGLVPGPGVVYVGTISTPQGPQETVNVVVLAATAGGISIAVTLITADSLGGQSPLANQADDIIDAIDFPAR